MKDAILRRRQRERKRTHYVKALDVPISTPEYAYILSNGNTPVPVFTCAAYKGDLIIALAGPGQLWSFNHEKDLNIPEIYYNFHEVHSYGLSWVNDDLVISAGCDGLIVSVSFSSTTSVRKFSFVFESIASLSDTEFVVGDKYGVLRFFEHRNGQDIRLIHSISNIHRSCLYKMAVHKGLMVTVSDCRTACVWDVSTRKRVAMLPHRYSVCFVAVNEHLIATTSFFEVRVFENGPGYRLSHVFKGLNGEELVYCVEVLGNNLLLTAGMGNLITATCLITNLPIMRVATRLPCIHDMALSSGGRIMVCSYKSVEEENDVISSQSESDLNGDARCEVIKLPRKYGMRTRLIREVRQRFETKPKKRRWKARVLAVIMVAVSIYIGRQM